MSKATVYNMEGKKVGDVQLEPKIFDVKPNATLVQQAVRTIQANKRVAIAHTKTRAEVRGGGKKPWAQKGTGRARHGSIRSPIWKGGGVTFGPRNTRNFSLKMNKKARRKALFMVLTDKAKDNKIVILDTLAITGIKTKALVQAFAKLPVKRSILTVLPNVNEAIIKSARNVPSLTTIQANSLNVIDVMNHEYLVMPKASLAVITKTYLA